MQAKISRAEFTRIKEWQKKNPNDPGHQAAVLETPPSGNNHIHFVYLQAGAYLDGPGRELYGVDRVRQRHAATLDGEQIDLLWED